MRALLTAALVLLFFGAAFKVFYKPASTPAYLQPPAAPPATPAPPVLPERTAGPPPSVLSPQEMERVLETTRDPNPNVRWEAAKLLVKTHAPQTAMILEEMMTKDTDAALRRNVVVLIGQEGGPLATRELTVALRDMEPNVRIAALQMLNRLGDYTAAPAISELLQDSDDQVRLTALNTLNALQTRRDDEARRQQEREAAERRKQEELLRQQQKGR